MNTHTFVISKIKGQFDNVNSFLHTEPSGKK